MAGLSEAASAALRGFEEDSKSHDLWCAKVDRWYRSWRFVLEQNSGADDWRSKLHPPYIFQIIETLCAGVLDPNPTWKVRARQRLTTADELTSVETGAKALQILLSAQRDQDQMVLKQRTHRLQGLIAGLTVWKPSWTLEERLVRKSVEVYNPDIEDYEDKEFDDPEPTKDDPTVECVDVRDWIPHESAREVQGAKRITHRCWLSYEDLLALEKRSVYRNVSDLKETKSFADTLASRETDLFDVDRTKDLIEVLEIWQDDGKVVTLGNRNVELSIRDNPFQHGMYPFIACSPMPDLFRMQGVSVVELVEDLQEMLWTLQNQRLDNLELLNNLIIKVREGSMFETPVFAPGEQWLMDDLSAAEPLTLPTFPAEISLQSEGLIKADIQNIPGASPALLGQAEGAEQTATEVSLLTNLAQRRLSAMKYQFTLADKMVGEQWIALNKQFLTEDRYVSVVGEDGEEGWELIHPDAFAPHEWRIEVEQMDEAMLRQERLAESQARFQVATAAAPLMAAIGQPLNMKAFLEDVLEAAGVQNKERYFSQMPQPMGAAQGQGGGSAAAAQPPLGPEGATAPQAIDMNSPSNAFSQSPVAATQRLGAMAGGPVNA